MRFKLIFLDTVDPLLGRVDYESLLQQALIEMVIGEITDNERICGDVDEPKDIEAWKGVTFEDGEAVEINWGQLDFRGFLHLEWLPPSVGKCTVNNNKLTAYYALILHRDDSHACGYGRGARWTYFHDIQLSTQLGPHPCWHITACPRRTERLWGRAIHRWARGVW